MDNEYLVKNALLMIDIPQKPLQRSIESPKKHWVVPIIEIIGTDNIGSGNRTYSHEGTLRYNGYNTIATKNYVS